MARQVQELKAQPGTVPPGTTLQATAWMMRDAGIGEVVVVGGVGLIGLVTDRDIVVRAVAEGGDPDGLRTGEVCSGEAVTVAPSDNLIAAVRLMREHAVRRLPVDGGQVVGVISLGDLAIERDETTALADISAARPNN